MCSCFSESFLGFLSGGDNEDGYNGLTGLGENIFLVGETDLEDFEGILINLCDGKTNL